MARLLDKIGYPFAYISSRIQKRFIFSLFITMLICFIVTMIIFEWDQNRVHKPNFTRNTNTEIIDGKEVTTFVSSPFTDASHYIMTTFSTVGYGDITPRTSLAKAWTNFMQFLVLVFSLKLFEYFYTDSNSIQALVKEIGSKNALISDLNYQISTLKNDIDSLNVPRKKSTSWRNLLHKAKENEDVRRNATVLPVS